MTCPRPRILTPKPKFIPSDSNPLPLFTDSRKPLESQENLSCCISHWLSPPPLTNGTQSDKWVLPRADVLVVGPVSIHVGSTVDQPGDVEGDGIAEDGSQEVGIPQTLSPEAPGHQRGNHEAHEHHADLIVPGRQNITLASGPW